MLTNGVNSFVIGICCLLAVLLTPALADVPHPPPAAGHPQPKLTKLPYKVLKRTVFLGDSITDGNTYPMLVRDGLAATGMRKITAINAGIGGDPATKMLARLDRDVFSQRPTLVTLFTSANDAGRVTAEEYEKTVRAIIERVQARHIPMILLTPESLEPTKPEKTFTAFAEYESVLRRLAAEYGLRIAEVSARMYADNAAGHNQHAPDGHPNYTGQRMIARAVLDAMGYPKAPVPARAHPTLQPGVIPVWKMRPVAPKEARLDAQAVAALLPDEHWVTVKLPETTPITGDENIWLDDARLQGTAIWLKNEVGGETGSYLGVATLSSRKQKTVYFNTGAGLLTIWLNGQRIYQNPGVNSWHLGRDTVMAKLQPGKNTIIIETGEIFFLSVTKYPYWK